MPGAGSVAEEYQGLSQSPGLCNSPTIAPTKRKERKGKNACAMKAENFPVNWSLVHLLLQSRYYFVCVQ